MYLLACLSLILTDAKRTLLILTILNNVLFTIIAMNLFILGGHLLDILDENLKTTPSIKLLFVSHV
jgi:hypothetical protein